jgi:hypothetical protein
MRPSPDRPPRKRRGFRWEFREGCQCKTCPWKGNCLGETWPHWREIKEGTDVSIGLVKKKKLPLYCSFCGKEQANVGYLVAGPNVFICNECVELCREIGQTMLVTNADPTEMKSGDEFRAALSRS